MLRYLSQKHGLHNCHVYLKPTRTEINGIPTVFLPWPLTKSKLLKARSSLVIAHIEKAGASYDSGKRITDHDFDTGEHFWVIGHLHNYQVMPRVVFPGAPLQLRQGDSLNKYFLHIKATVNSKSIECKFKKVAIKLPYKLKTIRIAALEDKKWQQQFKVLNSKTFVRLLIHTDVALPKEYLNHVQVMNHKFYGGKTQKTVTDETKMEVNVEGDSFNRMKVLAVYLGKLGMKGKKFEQALNMAEKYESTLRAKT